MKDKIGRLIGKAFSEINFPILINSYGRSGSTILTKSVIKSSIKKENKLLRKVLFRSISQSAWDLQNTNVRDGFVYKTHDYPPVQSFKNKVRMVYTYADPVDVVLSLIRLYDERGKSWMKEHYQHLQVPFSNFDRIVVEDQLCLEKHFDSWLMEKRFPIAFVKYESLWDHQEELSDFLEIPLKLPPYRERKTKNMDSVEVVSKLKKTYSSLIKKINNLDSYFINKARK